MGLECSEYLEENDIQREKHRTLKVGGAARPAKQELSLAELALDWAELRVL